MELRGRPREGVDRLSIHGSAVCLMRSRRSNPARARRGERVHRRWRRGGVGVDLVIAAAGLARGCHVSRKLWAEDDSRTPPFVRHVAAAPSTAAVRLQIVDLRTASPTLHAVLPSRRRRADPLCGV
jgi:hypothetical protein